VTSQDGGDRHGSLPSIKAVLTTMDVLNIGRVYSKVTSSSPRTYQILADRSDSIWKQTLGILDVLSTAQPLRNNDQVERVPGNKQSRQATLRSATLCLLISFSTILGNIE